MRLRLANIFHLLENPVIRLSRDVLLRRNDQEFCSVTDMCFAETEREREREPDEQLVFRISRKDDTAADRCGIEAVVVFVGAPLWLKVRASEHRKGLWPRGGSEAKVPSVGRFLPVSHHSVRPV